MQSTITFKDSRSTGFYAYLNTRQTVGSSAKNVSQNTKRFIIAQLGACADKPSVEFKFCLDPFRTGRLAENFDGDINNNQLSAYSGETVEIVAGEVRCRCPQSYRTRFGYTLSSPPPFPLRSPRRPAREALAASRRSAPTIEASSGGLGLSSTTKPRALLTFAVFHCCAQTGEEWYKCRNGNGEEGMIPATYLQDVQTAVASKLENGPLLRLNPMIAASQHAQRYE